MEVGSARCADRTPHRVVPTRNGRASGYRALYSGLEDRRVSLNTYAREMESRAGIAPASWWLCASTLANRRLRCSANGMEDFEGGMFGRRAVNLRRMTREPTHRNRRCLTVADRYWKAHAGTSRHTMTVERLQKIRVVKEDQVVVVRV